MHVRPAQLEDARAIAEVHVRAWQSAYAGLMPAEYLASLSVDRRETMWRESLQRGTPDLLVAMDAESVVGWVAFGPSRDAGAKPDVAEIWAIYVAPSHWGRGAGRQLWLGAQQRLRANGFASVGLWAFPENERAAGFYRGLGFLVDESSIRQFKLAGVLLNEVRYARLLDG